MRYGLLADVHANLHALRACLAAVTAAGVDELVVAGDFVGYGAHPNECIDELATAGAVGVAGNHDLIALGVLSDDRCIDIAKRSLAWTAAALTPESRAFLAALPRRLELPGGLVVAHGSLDDPQEYTRPGAAAARQLQRLAELAPSARVLVLGHTHKPVVWAGRTVRAGARPLVLEASTRALVNPGSVGQSRQRRIRARAAVLDLDLGVVTLLAVPYESDAARAALRTLGLSERGVHIPPSPRRRARRIVTRALGSRERRASLHA